MIVWVIGQMWRGYPYTIYAGQTLRLPENATVGQPAHDPENSAGEVRDEGAGSYTVKPGDYLKSIADRFGLEWSALAELNGLQYPYVIHTGQELRLK